MKFETAYALIGMLLVAVAVAASFLRRLPLSETMIYLAVGVILGPLGFQLFAVSSVLHAPLLHRLAEVGVLASLFSTGLKLRSPLHDRRWRIPIRLASISMTVTVGLIAALGVYGLGLPLGAAILLGGVLAPTDPVLASGVQVEHAFDRDRVRFSLTGEAGLNDGAAFPFVMLGLGLCGLHEIGPWGCRWFALDVLWAIGAGVGIGALFGRATALLVVWLRREHKEAVGRDEFIALGLIALSYGVAVLAHAYGFLAVFAAGVALRAVERQHTGEKPPPDVLSMQGASEEEATDPDKAPAHMAGAVLAFNEQLDRIMEVALVLVVGFALWPQELHMSDVWFTAVLFFIIRPVAVVLGILGSGARKREIGLLSWFGIRGIGSLYYLMYSIEEGLPDHLTQRLVPLTLLVIVLSIIVHGLTVTPLMAWYGKGQDAARAKTRNPPAAKNDAAGI